MRIFNCFTCSLALVVLVLLGGCGGGEQAGGAVVAKTTLTGPAPGVKSIEITLILPATVTPEMDPSTGNPKVTALSPNNVTSSNGLLYVAYTPASGAAGGRIKIVVIRGDAPFIEGDFLSIPCVVEAGKPVPSPGQFTYTDLKVWDTSGNDITSQSSGATVTAVVR
ncbi:hypothetical protein [Geobacter sp. SVR]|uniref:hypothetical protein n=1 Tax=Geobacter sp. SVR TaxID=2495594 RepID=UPI00143EFDD3|nr:hypothetical protein [Geobacter sp. SVR]BCS55466.1 hypothetical protein GSVR_37740 [Geobacter sp. SVR]GCF83469.1 hypothetical protein GSbR_00690 [Geobacter sp. SVR]